MAAGRVTGKGEGEGEGGRYIFLPMLAERFGWEQYLMYSMRRIAVTSPLLWSKLSSTAVGLTHNGGVSSSYK
jgi:hypothetical protein